MASLLDFLGPVGGQRRIPQAGDIRAIDPNDDPLGPYMMGGGAPQQPNPLAAFVGGSAPSASPDWMRSLDMNRETAMNDVSPMAAFAGMPTGPRAPRSEPKRGGLFDFLGGSQDEGLRDTLGRVGDALLTANDLPAMYEPRRQHRIAEQRRQELGEAMAAFVGDNPLLANIARIDPAGMGAMLYNVGREDRRFDRTAGQRDAELKQTGEYQRGQLGMSAAELAERARQADQSAGLTQRGQNITAQTQLQLEQMRSQAAQEQARLESELTQARAVGDARLETILLRQKARNDIAIAALDEADEVTERTYNEDGEVTREVKRTMPRAGSGGEIRYGPDGRRYRRGPNGEAIPVN